MGDGASYAPNPRSPVRLCKADRPQPRGIAGSSQARPRCAREVSAAADSMAVGPVSRELVSSPKSLIFRENTGKFSRSWLPARPASPIRAVLEVLAGVFPAFGNREILPTSTDSRQGAATAGPSATIVPASSIRELLAFWVGRLLVGWPWEVALPGLPQIRTCAIDASGSSVYGLAARVGNRWTIRGGGSG